MEKWQKRKIFSQQNPATPIAGEHAHRHGKEGKEERKMRVRSRGWDAATDGAGGQKREEYGPAEQNKTGVILFMDFSAILTAGEGARSRGKERKEERKEKTGLPPTPVRSPASI